MQAIFFALVSFFGWGTGDIFGTISSRKIGPYSTTFWYLFLELVLTSILAIFVFDKPQLTLPIFLFTLFVGALGILGLLAFYEGLRSGSASLTGTIASSAAALAVLIAVLILKERLVLPQVAALACVFIGVTISSLNVKDLRIRRIERGVLFSIIALVCWGFYYSLIKIPIKEIGWFWATYIATWALVPLPIIMKFKNIKIENPIAKKALFPVIANTLLLGGGTFSLNIAIEKGLASVVVPIGNAYPALFAVCAFLIFKDPIKRQQIVGIIVTLIGIILLSIFSV